jgi:hypothetical protein
MGRMVDSSALPAPPMQFDTMNQMPLPHAGANLSGGMMMNQQMANNFGNNMGTTGMMSPQQLRMQNQISAQQSTMNQLNQQLQQQQQQMSSNQSDYAELQMLQNKLQSMRQTLNSQMASQNMYQGSNHSQFEPHAIDHNMPPPLPVQSETPRQPNMHCPPDQQSTLSSSISTKQQLPQNKQQQRVDTLPGNNPRRMPPPSLMKREDSMKMDKIFMGNSPQSTKKKYDGNGSSAHMSAMSLSIGDMQEDGNLSLVFDSSLRISNDKLSGGEAGHRLSGTKEKLKDRSSTSSWDPNSLEMSVNTIGTGAGMSEAGAMSYATFGDPSLHESDGNMSFGKVFENPDKD